MTSPEPIRVLFSPENTEELNQYRSIKRLVRRAYGTFLTWLLGGLFILLILALIALPWQQNVVGKGEVTVFSPMDRPQTIHAPIDSRIVKWHVAEGEWVQEGDILVSLAEIKADYLDPMQVDRLDQERNALLAQKKAIHQQLLVMGGQLDNQKTVQRSAVPAARLKVSQAQNKVLAAKQKLMAAKQAKKTAQANLVRRQDLFDKGLRSQRDLELAQLKVADADAKVQSADSALAIAQQEARIADFSTQKINAETSVKQQDVLAKQATLLEKKAKLDQTLAKLDNKIASIKQRVEQRTIRAVTSGQVTRVLALGAGETVKANTSLLKITPKTSELAAALYIEDWNVPIIQLGRTVRLQFAGFPAIQFSGWPGVSKGTFAGKVTAIDAAGDGTGVYRVLVQPDEDAISHHSEEPWPESDVLRPGAQVIGWVMLDTVPLWYELWRIFNGFPLTVEKPSSSGSASAKDMYKDDAKLLKNLKQRK